MNRRSLSRLGLLLFLLAASILIGWYFMIRMPGKSWSGPLEPLSARESALIGELRRDIDALSAEIGEKNILRKYEALQKCAGYIRAALEECGYQVESQTFTAEGKTCENIEAVLTGRTAPDEIVVVGAHYDTVAGAPGANDNGSGVAGVLAIARVFARDGGGAAPGRTVRFVLFVNEEPPFFQTDGMGSLVYARRCREREENIVAMLSLETIGYYSDDRGSQKYPPPFGFFYPSTGNFIAFVGNTKSRTLVRTALDSFRKQARFPSEGAALPGFLPGVGWSDHWSFWQAGYPGLMVTDTAPFRYPHYHLASDTADKIDFERMARVVAGLEKVVRDLAE